MGIYEKIKVDIAQPTMLIIFPMKGSVLVVSREYLRIKYRAGKGLHN